jgi:threonine/homoserine/homoserine lactone efflux protein
MIRFLVVAVVVVVVPGPDFGLTLRNSISRARGLATALGVVTGLLLWALAAAVGLVALLVASRPAFEALRLAGAAYLVWLGGKTLFSRRRDHGDDAAVRRGSPYRQGLVNNLSNPKMPVFFTSLLPQFGTSFAVLAVHGAIFAALTLAWLAFVARAGAALRVPSVRRALDVVTGVVLVAFGLRLASEQR